MSIKHVFGHNCCVTGFIALEKGMWYLYFTLQTQNGLNNVSTGVEESFWRNKRSSVTLDSQVERGRSKIDLPLNTAFICARSKHHH